MTAPSDLLLNAFLRFYPAKPTWLKSREHPKALVEALLGSPLFAGIAIGNTNADEFEAVTAAKAVKMVASGRQVAARFHDREDDSDLTIDLDLRAERCEVRLNVAGAALASRGDKALDDLVAVMQACIAALRGTAGLGDGSIQADSTSGAFEFPRPRPPRTNDLYPEGSVVTFLDATFHASGAEDADRAAIAALTKPAPPAPAKTTTTDGVVTVRWARTCDAADLEAGASAHAVWIAQRLAPDIDRDFNELGDQREERAFNSKPRGKLTFYDPNSEIGYKAVLVLPDGKPEPTAWNDAKKIAKAGTIDGATVAAVRIVVPLRHQVFEVAADARKAGFDAVLYPDAQGNFWNPDPPGKWIGPPIRNDPPKGTTSQKKAAGPRSRGK